MELESEKLDRRAAIYLTRKTMDAVADLFSQAHKIKKWLIECARLAVQHNQPMAWITPLGVPVIQPYRRLTRVQSMESFDGHLALHETQATRPLMKKKQMSAFPPNFVHRYL